MAKRGYLERHGIVRNAIRKDIIQFAIPALTIFTIELIFCARHGLTGFWGTIRWGLVKQPQILSLFPVLRIVGLALSITGLTIMIVGQATLRRNYSGAVAHKGRPPTHHTRHLQLHPKSDLFRSSS